jgi:glycerol kinase
VVGAGRPEGPGPSGSRGSPGSRDTLGSLFLAIDQGTTSTRAIGFTPRLEPVATAARPLEVTHPRAGWAEEDPEGILESVVDSVAEVVEACGGVSRFAAVGLANQGETVVAWDDRSGAPLAPAVLWQCGRSAGIIDRLRAAGQEPEIRGRTGLPLDPYYSAGKLTWLLENEPAVQRARDAGTLRFGTVDAWLTARLGHEARTDPSTASRTQLFDLAQQDWSPKLLGLFGVPSGTLPRLGPTAGSLGELRHERWAGALALTAMACDQQAALAGHGGFAPGALKATYGTGVFVVAHAGTSLRLVDGIETSVAWSLPGEAPAFVLQGGVLAAGSLLDWLRDGLGLFGDVGETEAMALSVADTAGVTVLPSLGGVGAPWWLPRAGGVIAGFSGAADRRHIVRASLDGIAHRACDVVDAMTDGLAQQPDVLRVDGGLTANRYLMQRQADLLGIPVVVAADAEATSRGIAALAAFGAGATNRDELASSGAPLGAVFQPRSDDASRTAEREAWQRFVSQAGTLRSRDEGAA